MMKQPGIIRTKDGMLYPCVELGGPGSGNFGHAGIPGQVGGSSAGSGGGSGDIDSDIRTSAAERSYSMKIRDGVASGFAKKADTLDVEHALIFDATGKAITIKGERGAVSIPKEVIVKDMHLVHNHPGENFPGLSPADVSAAIKNDMASITATGTAGIITIDRPPGGWPNITDDDVKSAYSSEFKRVRGIVNNAKSVGLQVSPGELSKELRDSSKNALGKLGIDVKYVSRF